MKYTINYATPADIDSIMHIERTCFSSRIQEKEESFLNRLKTFPEGFLLLSPGPAGYLCSELWEEEPPAKKSFWELGHYASNRHVISGSILYISSFAVLPESRGGTGRFFFNSAISHILQQKPGIRRIVFIVNETWMAARHIYETEGFSYGDSIPEFFDQEKPGTCSTAALIMGKYV